MCLYVGLWLPLASKDRQASELVVLARRLGRELALVILGCDGMGSSESDSGTVSRVGSRLCEQVQRPPWPQQQLSANEGQESEEQSLDQSDTTMLTLVAIEYRSQVHALMRLLTAVALDVGCARLAHCAAVLALRNRPSLLVDVLKWPICARGLAHSSIIVTPRPT